MFPCSSCQYRFPTVNAPMSHMPDNNITKSNDDNDAKPFIPKETPILVTLSATALGSLGFGLSIFVMWLRWLVPSVTPTPATVTTTNALRTRRRRSVPLAPPAGALIPPFRRVTTPVSPNPLEVDETLHHSKHVHSLDPRLSNDRSESLARETSAIQGESSAQPHAQLQPPVDGSSGSLLSSSSTIAIQVQVKVDLGDEPFVESDSSSRRSLSKRLPKMKNPFIGRRRQSANADMFSETRPTDSDDLRTTRRSSTNHGSPRSATGTLDGAESDVPSQKSFCPFGRRNSKSTATVPSSSGLSSELAPSPSPSRFSRKARRPSTAVPVPRTLPYEAPYFAAPPSYFPQPKHPSSGNETGQNSGSRRYLSPRRPVGSESTAKRRSASDNLANPRRATLE